MTAGQLRRELGLLDATAIGFGAIIGAGIFVVTGVAAGMAGPAVLLSLLIAGVAAAANALSSAELAVAYPQAGGAYEYGYRVLNPWAGFAAGWMFLASKIAAAGTVAIGLSGYVEALVPGAPTRAIAVTAVLGFTVLNYLGVRRSSRVNVAIVLVSVGALALFVAAGAAQVRMSNLTPFATSGTRGVLRAAALLFFAYTGYARIATLAEEVRDPARVIPKAILTTVAGAILIYLAVAFVAVGGVGAAALAGTAAPLHLAAQRVSPWMGTLVSAGAVSAMLGVILSQLLGMSRVVFAMARRGDLPRALDHVHPRHRVPGRAVLAVGGLAAVVAATGSLTEVASAASFTILVYYGIVNAAALRLRAEAKLFSDIVPVVGLAGCVLLALSLSREVVLTGLVTLAIGCVARLALRRGEIRRAA